MEYNHRTTREINLNKFEQLINKLSNLTIFIEDEQSKTCPPAKHGHYKHWLVSQCYKVVDQLRSLNPDLEQEGTVKINGHTTQGATALWCAVWTGKFTPTGGAYFTSDMQIEEYLKLVDEWIHIADKHNITYLMIAAYKGHFDIVRYLLENGEDPNKKTMRGTTALHIAAECDHLEVVKLLLSYKAKFTLNEAGLTPIMAAAYRFNSAVVEYLAQHPDITKEQKIEAFELLGASFATCNTTNIRIKSYKYLYKSMEMRYSDPDNILKKKLIPPIRAYGYWVECQTLAELELIQDNENSLRMEGLTIRERILGVQNPQVPPPILLNARRLFLKGSYDRCLELFLHAIKLRQQNHVSVAIDLHGFFEVFSIMLKEGVKITYYQVIEVLSAAILELERNKVQLNWPEPKDDPEIVMDNIETNMNSTLNLLIFLTKLMKDCTEEENLNVKQMVFALIQLQITPRNGQTLLHLSCNAKEPVDFHTNDVWRFPQSTRFPCAQTTRLLILCGADVNAMDSDRNTPLHVIVNYHKAFSDFLTVHSIITDLMENGAHLDCVNYRGETPLDSSATEVAEILKSQMRINLKCLAANALRQHKISFKGQVPKALESFIELHVPGSVKKQAKLLSCEANSFLQTLLSSGGSCSKTIEKAPRPRTCLLMRHHGKNVYLFKSFYLILFN